MEDVVIVSAVRTAIAKKGGALASVDPAVYGGEVISEALRRADVEHEAVEDVIFGNCLSGGGNTARVSLLEGGLPVEVPGLTIDRQCGSGINSVALAAEKIIAGNADVVVAGGTESMTRSPHLLEVQEKAYDRKPPKFINRRLSPDAIGDPPMGITAENLAEKYEVSREEQDAFALRSQERMADAVEKGYFKDQIHPIEVKTRKGTVTFDQDEHPRPEVTKEALGKLPPVFKKDGSVTAGSSSGINDGASALVLMSGTEAKKRELKPLARVTASAVAGVDPNIMGIGPVPAVKKVLEKTGGRLDDFDLIELNEAFAAQVLACDRELSFDMDKVNVNGGAIAHGHPIAATGGMLVTKLCYELERRGEKKGLATACIGGGQGIALVVERD
ncbi:thiolase family protein [Salicibibacter kimchii]|uniref:acetyl-CoA C-acetyltransferase n=1 Tax=Salicibibacter kimchii TaxID=2099786 RepID=A0A345BWR5_9BACI|nr:thiolase family protein [Salicibibacter kimchii]AXF55396.1 thiolase family protein [Salicibibacter kimchii]